MFIYIEFPFFEKMLDPPKTPISSVCCLWDQTTRVQFDLSTDMAPTRTGPLWHWLLPGIRPIEICSLFSNFLAVNIHKLRISLFKPPTSTLIQLIFKFEMAKSADLPIAQVCPDRLNQLKLNLKKLIAAKRKWPCEPNGNDDNCSLFTNDPLKFWRTFECCVTVFVRTGRQN